MRSSIIYICDSEKGIGKLVMTQSSGQLVQVPLQVQTQFPDAIVRDLYYFEGIVDSPRKAARKGYRRVHFEQT